MKCLVCKREMVLLLVFYACDHCEGDGPSNCYSGYIVFQPERIGMGNPFHVFRSRMDAAIWRSKTGLQKYHIREVFSEEPFLWKLSQGTIDNIQLASQPFEIFADHRFAPHPNRAFLAPLNEAKAA